MFDILQEILQSHPFLISQSFKIQGCQWNDVNRLILFTLSKGIVEQGLPHVFVISMSSHFFNKTNLEQHLRVTVGFLAP